MGQSCFNHLQQSWERNPAKKISRAHNTFWREKDKEILLMCWEMYDEKVWRRDKKRIDLDCAGFFLFPSFLPKFEEEEERKLKWIQISSFPGFSAQFAYAYDFSSSNIFLPLFLWLAMLFSSSSHIEMKRLDLSAANTHILPRHQHTEIKNHRFFFAFFAPAASHTKEETKKKTGSKKRKVFCCCKMLEVT